MSIGIDKLAHMNTPALSDILLAHSAAEGTGVVAIGDLPKLLNAGNLKMPDSDETIAEHYRQFCNRNLLINGYLGRPVNQRGQENYDTQANTSSLVYTIDMWKASGAVITMGDNFVNFTSSKGVMYKRFTGKTEHTLEAGRTYTLSMLAKVNAVSGNVVLRPCSSTYGGLGIDTKIETITDKYELFVCTITLQQKQSNIGVEILCGNTVNDWADIDIKALKLELGPNQTLAHKEGSEWVLNEIPDYATELAKCQRYLRVFRSIPNGFITSGGVNLISYIPALSDMRSNPAIILENLSIALRLPSGYSPIASFENPLQIVDGVYTSYSRIRIVSNEILGENNVPASVEFRSGRIIFSSEL